MKPVICSTEKEYAKSSAIFAKSKWECISVPADEDALAAAIREHRANAVIVGVDAYQGALYKALPAGSVIARYGVGHDGIDKFKATHAGIIVTNTPGVLDVSVAEHTLWLMGATAKRLAQHHYEMKNDQWLPKVGMELAGKRLLLLGCGRIGSMVARMASFGFAMEVVAFDIGGLDAAHMKAEYGISKLVRDTKGEIDKADFVSVHLPAIEATRHFVDKEFLAKMKHSAVLINTSRGSLVNENELYTALQDGVIAGAGLDVFEVEPYAPIDPAMDLRKLNQAVLTPHISSSTRQACNRVAERSLKNVAGAIAKKYHGLDIVNPAVLEQL